MRLPGVLRMGLVAFGAWKRDRVPTLGAALAYYTLFSIAPILLVAIAVAGVFFGPEAARGEIVGQIDQLIGPEGARAIESLLAGARDRQDGLLASIIGVVTFVVAATGAFMQLQDALNTIWRVKPRSGKKLKALHALRDFVLKRLKSFGLIVAIGFLLMVSLVVSAGLSAAAGWLNNTWPGVPVAVWDAANLAISVGVITGLFAMVYRILPDVQLRWRDVWVGAVITAILFTVGKELIGIYLGRSSTASTFGAAGSIVVLMVWVYYSSQIVLFGAELTRVYVRTRHRQPAPEPHARQDLTPPRVAPPDSDDVDRPPAEVPAGRVGARLRDRRWRRR